MNSVGTTFGSITKDELYSLPIVLPDHDTLLSFEKICAPIYDKQMVIGEEIESLTKQRDELLPLLMNGQVSLNYHLSYSFAVISILYRHKLYDIENEKSSYTHRSGWNGTRFIQRTA